MSAFVLSLEGVDASGKSTLAAELTKKLTAAGYSVRLLHDDSHPSFTVGEAVDLYYAATTIVAENEILTTTCDVVILDRYIDSLLAYAVRDSLVYSFLERIAHGVIQPDLTLFMNVDMAELHKRWQTRGEAFSQSAVQEVLDRFFAVIPRQRIFFVTPQDSVEYVVGVVRAAIARKAERETVD